MAWPAPRRHQHDIEAQRSAGEIGPALQEMLERTGDAAPLLPQNRFGGAYIVCARLDLDRGNGAAAPRDEINLAHGRAIALCQDAIALQPQRPKAKPLGPLTAPVRCRAAARAVAHRPPLSASARA